MSSVPYFLLVNLLHLFHPFLLAHVLWVSACSHCYLLLNWSISFLKHSIQSWTLLQIFLATWKVQKVRFTVPTGCYPFSLVHLSMVLIFFTITWHHHMYSPYSTFFLPPGPYLMNCYLVGWWMFCICSVHSPCWRSMSFIWACWISSYFGDHSSSFSRLVWILTWSLISFTSPRTYSIISACFSFCQSYFYENTKQPRLLERYQCSCSQENYN